MIEIHTQEGKMKDVLKLAETVAGTKSSVLIIGEMGTGKSTLAKYIHERSGRSQAPCITVNCAQQPEMLLETELFGFEKGAFAGTVSEKRGKFEQANGGTLVLDDVSELSPKLQAKVLRIFETGTVERIGSKAGVPIDVRVIAISSKSIQELVAQGKFLESLLYKINSVQLAVPPLRERFSDLRILVASILGKATGRGARRVSGATEEAIQKLATHHFTGNIRELEGIVERAMISAQDGLIRPNDITVGQMMDNIHQGAGAHSVDWEAQAQWAPGRTLEEIERAVILRSLAFHNGNRTHTARELGISIRTLRNKLNEYRKAGINV